MLKNQQDIRIQLGGQLETIAQAKVYLQGMSEQSYQAILSPHFSGSAGAHMRHILDHYIALKDGMLSGTVDYNKRHRFSEVEKSPAAAMQMWLEIEHWLERICQLSAHMPLMVSCETSLQQTQNSITQSTLARELVFVSSHAVHHFSLLAVIASLQGRESDNNFGMAPATVSHMRRQAS
ncbi:MAG: hypothetical protein ACI88A_002555 [Paraglaciecola sp.]|jgi:hypothetical protein